MKPVEMIYSSIDTRRKSYKLNSILYFISQYGWLLLMALALPIKNQKHYQTVPEIKQIQHLQKWNTSYNPHTFGLVSDAHITPFHPERFSNTKSIFKILKESGVEKILVAGDISDNFGSNQSFKLGQQYEDDFIDYQRIEKDYPSNFIIVASGNHDEFDVEDYKSKDHYILQYCDFYKKNKLYDKYENFLISKVIYEDVEIFVMNPYDYPTVRAGVGYYMHLTTNMLDIIEKALSGKSDLTTRILITHFSTSFSNRNVYSTSGKTLQEIISSSNIASVIAGHSHAFRIIHRNSTLEIHSPSIHAGRRSGKCYGYITIDNGYFSYHNSSLNEEPPTAVLTYPISPKYLSKMTDFSPEKYYTSEIRVVTFSDDSKLNISVKCNNNNGFLHFDRILRPKQSLYSAKLSEICGNLKNDDQNSFNLTFSGDWSYSANFFVGKSVKLDDEEIEDDLNLYIATFAIGLLMYLIVLFVWCPFIPPSQFCNEINMWISGSNIKSATRYIGLLFGFLAMKSRIYSNLSKRTQILFFCVALSPLIVPISIMKIGESQFGFILSVGYYLKGFVWDIWGFDLFGLFAILVLVPATIVLSSIAQIKQTIKYKLVFVVDAAMAIAQVPLAAFAIGRFLYQSTPLIYAVTSPAFGIGTAVILCLEACEFYRYFIWYIST